MIGHLRVQSPWSQLGIFFGLLGAAFIVTSLMMFAILFSGGVNPQKIDLVNPDTLMTMKWLQAMSSVTIFFLPAWLYGVICFNGRPFYFLGLRPAEKQSMYVLAILCILLAFPFVLWLGQLNQQIPLPEWVKGLEEDATRQMEAFLRADSLGDVLINVFIIALLPAICEEICFRGALQRILIHIFRSPWIGIIVASIIFSAIHFQFQGFLPRMFLGVVLGALYWYSGSLWPSILAHFVNNAVQVVVVSYYPEYVTVNPDVPVYMGLLSGVFVAAILWLYGKQSTASYKKIYNTNELNEHNQFLA
jgi:uncharacterized protein